MIVVTHEKPAGSWFTYCRPTSRRNARNPELRSGIFVSTRKVASLRMNHFAGTRSPLVGALLGGAGADHLVVAVELLHERGDRGRSGTSCRRRSTRRRVPPPRACRPCGPSPSPGSRRTGSAGCRRSPRGRRARRDPSLEPSSTTMISYEYGDASSAAWMRSISARRCPASLYTGRMTLTSSVGAAGAGESGCVMCPRGYWPVPLDLGRLTCARCGAAPTRSRSR